MISLDKIDRAEYNFGMFLNAVQTYAVGIIIAVVVAQYAFAIFCLLKLAYLDIPKKQYVLWNLLILLVFFIGGAAFLIYYYKVKDEKTIPPYEPDKDGGEQAADGAEETTSEDNAPDADAEKEQDKQ